MSTVNINIPEATVTAIHEFNNFKGYGLDIYVEAKSPLCTVYFQVVLYDNEARSTFRYVHQGDTVTVAGDLKVKPYRKNDGSYTQSLIVERPISFRKIWSSNSNSQLQQDHIESRDNRTSDQNSAVTMV